MRSSPVLLRTLLAVALCVPGGELQAASQRLEVRARILPAVSLRGSRLPAAVEVPAAAHADTHAESSVEVYSSAGSFALHFAVLDAAVAQVDLEGLGDARRFAAQGTTVQVRIAPGERNLARRTLTYRIRYAPGTPPGPRPFPLRIYLQDG